jgi:hypothetical protein
METISDKEVGELWQQCIHHGWTSKYWNIANLIRKLVEERQNCHQKYITHEEQQLPKDELMKLCDIRIREGLEESLRDFGIDPTTWWEE